jgi:arylsulfatase A-like enzyme
MQYSGIRLISMAAFVAALQLFLILQEPGGAHAADLQPNIVYIVADDLGWKDVGFHGSDIKTPHLDALAANGAKLDDFYAQPMCTPTRAALMTGRYPMRYGLQTAVIPQGHTYGLALDEWLLPQALKEAGYETAIVGKWHLGHADPKYWPLQRGFDYQYGPLIGEIDYFTHKVDGKVDWYRNNEVVEEEGYSTTLLGDDAVRLIEDHNPNTPLFLYLAFNAVHTPYQAPRNISTSTRASKIQVAALMPPARQPWTTKSGVSSPHFDRSRCSITRSSFSRATTAELAILCLPVR